LFVFSVSDVMGLFLLLPAFAASIALIAAVHWGLPWLRAALAEGGPPPGEIETLEIWSRAHGGVLELPRRFLLGPRELDGAKLACRIEEKKAWVELEGNGPFRARAAVDVDAALDLEIRRPTFFRRKAGSARVSTMEAPEDEQPDVRFDVRRASDKTGELREKLFVHAGESLTKPLAELLYRTGADVVRARDGQLEVAFAFDRLVSEHVNEALVALAEIARAYARKPEPIAMGALVERYLWLEGNAPRCPYCHVDIPEGAPDLAACERCRTLHHAACFAEHGGCTLLGCPGKKPL
jgi:hypothetical protein